MYFKKTHETPKVNKVIENFISAQITTRKRIGIKKEQRQCIPDFPSPIGDKRSPETKSL